MQQLNAYQFYELGARLHSLFNLRTQGRVADMFAPLTEAQTLLDGFIKGDPFALETSKADANRLLAKISSVFNRYFIDPTSKQLKNPTGEDRIDAHELSLIMSLVEKFEHALGAELNRAPTYLAQKRGIYSTYDLAEKAHAIFSKELQAVIPQTALSELDLAGRALVFGLGTASSLHILRALEITLKPYYELFAAPATSKNERNYSIYLKKLSALADEENVAFRPDKRVVQMLSQIKDHYRNPLIAAESSITLDDALSLFGMATALMTLMAGQIHAQHPAEGKKNTKPANPGEEARGEDDEALYDFRLSQTG
jgi:hypothetical protein